MQIAILAVLVLIACILAPWLLGVLAAGIALYGVWLIMGLIVAIVAGCAVFFWLLLSSKRTSKPTRTEQMISDVNLQTRASEALERVRLESEPPVAEKAVKTVPCASCGAEIEKYALYCAVCGKPTKGALRK